MIVRTTFRPILSIAGALAVLLSPASASALTIDWVTVGNAGNDADSSVAWPHPGAVAYEYRIAKHEVTNAQYAEFLNAVAATDTNNLYNTQMGLDSFGGITRSGSSGSFTYAVKTNMGNKPVNYVSWYDAARFSNWMTNGQPSGSGTESGVYSLTGPTSIGSITRDLRNPDQVFIPTEDEWYKAAFHQPADQGGDSDDYWLYPTASNNLPIPATATSTGDIANPGANVANYNLGADWNGRNGNVTTVGSAGPGSESFYGTSDQAGNVSEWNETLFTGATPKRGLRDGSFFNNENALQASFRLSRPPTDENVGIGFRVARPVPEPGSLAMLTVVAPLILRPRRLR